MTTIGASPAEAAANTPPVTAVYPVRGDDFTLSGRLSTKVVRPIEVQQKVGNQWRQIAQGATRDNGRYSISVSIDSATVQLRIVAAKVKIGKRTFSRIVTEPATVRSLSVSPTRPLSGETFTVSQSLRTPGPRRAYLQRKSGNRWVTLSSTKTSATGSYRFTTSVSTSTQLRVYAPAATVKNQRRAAITTRTFRINTTPETAAVNLPDSVRVGETLTATATFSPIRVGRGAQLQRLVDGRWEVLASSTQDGSGRATLTATADLVGTFSYRVVSMTYRGAAGVASAATTITSAGGIRALAIDIATPPTTATDEQFNAVLLVAGGTAPYAWTATGLPAGIELTDDGRLTGRPTTPGNYVVRLTAVDAQGLTATTDVEIVVVAALTITTEALPTAVQGTAYQTTLTATGGSESYTWSATNLPDGVALSGDGTLSGTPTQVGQHQLSVTLTDSNSRKTTKMLTLPVTAPLEITTTSLPDGSLNTAYEINLAATGGTSPYVWSTTSTPAGLTLSETGTLAGTPTAAGTTQVGLTVTDSLGATATSTLSLTVTSVSFTALAAGDTHSCALNSDGGVICWGRNNYGQLGNDTLIDSKTPVAVSGLESGVTAVATGTGFSCALTSGGGVKCWGYNSTGQLGNNDQYNTSAKTPVDVSGLTSGVAAITAGGKHACAVTTAGAAWCWGSSAKGQLGNSSMVDRKYPVSVTDLTSGVTAIAAGAEHTCAVKSGGAWCWGTNGAGQVGIDTAWTTLTSPRGVTNLASGVASVVAAGNHSCAVTTSGAATCWGSNTYGELGNNSTTSSYTPVAVDGLTSGVLAVTGGTSHSCALSTGGTVSCWGRNDLGQLGDATRTDSATPVTVTNLSGEITALASGLSHSCATNGSSIKCWGGDDYGQLGDGGGLLQPRALEVTGLTDAVSLATAEHAACALSSSGGVRCWGRNTYGQLGNGTTTNSVTPVAVSGLSSGVAALAGGTSHVCALTTAGAVKCWGLNTYGQLGDGGTTNSSTPVQVSGLDSGVTAIASSSNHTCAIIADKTMKCWGRNNYSQIGDGTTTNATTPIAVPGLGEVTAIAAGGYHTCAVTDGAVKCWGYNQVGQLGDGTTTARTTPTSVPSLATGVTAIVADSGHTCAIAAGAVKCWGYNGSGRLGDGTMTNASSPVSVVGMDSGAAAISVAGSNTCALSSSGVATCWGYGGSGQIGDGTTTTRSTPTAVDGVGTVAAVETGLNFTCAASSSGGVRCWGTNDYGQLGHETNAQSTPVEVSLSAG